MSGVPVRDFPGLRLLERDGRVHCEIDPIERDANQQRRLELARVEINRALGWWHGSRRLDVTDDARQPRYTASGVEYYVQPDGTILLGLPEDTE